MANKRKCRATHCFHETKDFMPGDDIVEVGRNGYHRDCYQAISDIKEVTDIFSTKINKNVVFAELRRVINNIVYTKGVESGMLLFGINYYINNNIPLRYPQGLYYVVQNQEVQKQYHQMKIAQEVKNYTFDVSVDNSKSFTYKPEKTSSFTDILGGAS